MSNELAITKKGDFAAQVISTQDQEQEQHRPPALEVIGSSSKNQHFDNVETDDTIEDSSQINAEDKTVFTVLPQQNSESEYDDGGHVIYFEFSLKFRKISEYMRPLFREIGNNGDVWFSGSIDKRTGRVLSSNIGRMH